MTIICARYGEAAYGVSRYCEDTPVDHVADAQEQVWNRFKKCPNFTALAKVTGKRFQILSNDLEDIRAVRDLDVATGTNLDKLGAIVGQDREGFSDLIYRTLIKAKTAANRSKGTTENLIETALILRNGVTTDITYTELFPASVQIDFLNSLETLQHQALIADLLFLTKLGGVRLVVTFSTSTPFGFDGDPDAFGFETGQFTSLYSSS
jgi:hypothetical protein